MRNRWRILRDITEHACALVHSLLTMHSFLKSNVKINTDELSRQNIKREIRSFDVIFCQLSILSHQQLTQVTKSAFFSEYITLMFLTKTKKAIQGQKVANNNKLQRKKQHTERKSEDAFNTLPPSSKWPL